MVGAIVYEVLFVFLKILTTMHFMGNDSSFTFEVFNMFALSRLQSADELFILIIHLGTYV